jgi:hypothetical protein
MKKLLLVLSIFISTSAVADDVDRSPFYLALSNMSPDMAAYTFMVEQFLEVKCGKKQPLENIKAASESRLNVSLELKAGNYKSAQKLINEIQCK